MPRLPKFVCQSFGFSTSTQAVCGILEMPVVLSLYVSDHRSTTGESGGESQHVIVQFLEVHTCIFDAVSATESSPETSPAPKL